MGGCGGEARGSAEEVRDHVSGFGGRNVVGCGEAGAGLGGDGCDEDLAICR